MAEYIEREALLKGIDEFHHTAHIQSLTRETEEAKILWKGIHSGVNYSRNHIIEAPTADVVEVVRKPVVGYEDYYTVDQFGRVYGIDRTTTVLDNGRIYEKPIAGKQMKQSIHTKGYKTVTLTKGGKTKTRFVHRIVAEAFIPNPDRLPMVNHKDEDKTNNFVENLEWCTASYNRTYGNSIKKQSRKIRGRKHTAEHNQKIAEGVKRSYGERKPKETVSLVDKSNRCVSCGAEIPEGTWTCPSCERRWG